jgi:hypothetical protein
MSILCRLTGHLPLRDKQLIDIDGMTQHAWCKRCGAALEREPGTPWRGADPVSAGSVTP